jgi:hypothetical protein
MTTKLEKIAAFKAQYPTLRIGSDEVGYTDLTNDEYEATITIWADNELAAEASMTKIKADRDTLLAKLNITEDEALILLTPEAPKPINKE